MGLRNVVRYLRAIFTLRVENEPGSGSTNLGRESKVVNPFYVTMVGRALSSASWGYFGPHPHTA